MANKQNLNFDFTNNKGNIDTKIFLKKLFRLWFGIWRKWEVEKKIEENEVINELTWI
jgi:hypothetical protein